MNNEFKDFMEGTDIVKVMQAQRMGGLGHIMRRKESNISKKKKNEMEILGRINQRLGGTKK